MTDESENRSIGTNWLQIVGVRHRHCDQTSSTREMPPHQKDGSNVEPSLPTYLQYCAKEMRANFEKIR